MTQAVRGSVVAAAIVFALVLSPSLAAWAQAPLSHQDPLAGSRAAEAT